MVYIIFTLIIHFAGIGHHVGHYMIIDLLCTVKKEEIILEEVNSMPVAVTVV